MDDHLLFLDPPIDPHIDRRYLHFRRGNWGLRLTVDSDRSYWRVRVRLADPLHHPDRFISVLIDPDHELLLLDDLTSLDAESQRTIRQSLDQFYAVPTITRVHSLSYKLGPMYWQVETTHGEREFVLYWSSEHIVYLPSGEVRLIDVSGNRYTLPESNLLDEKSRTLIREALT